MITEPELAIESKGVDTVSAPNRLHVVMASNEDWVVPATQDERRFAVFELSPDHIGDHEYFAALRDEPDNRVGIAAMLHDLLDMDLGGWHPRREIPQTEALSRQQAETLPPHEQAWLVCLRTGELPNIADVHPAGDVFLPTKDFADDVSKGLRRAVSADKIADLLGPGCSSGRLGMDFPKEDRSRPRGYRIPPLHEARAAWDRKRFPVAWPDVDRWDTVGAQDYPGQWEKLPF